MIEFELNRIIPTIIKVIGVGGGGSNAVNHMFRQGINGVEFLVCNTDAQALEISPVPRKIQLGPGLTQGRGAGSIPEVGKQAAIENIDELKNALKENTKMVFITAGMGGGTGTGAAPIIAGVAKEMGILTVGIVSMPFSFEGKKRRLHAESGIEEMKKNVDALLVIRNDKLREIHGNLFLTTAFGHADDVLTVAAKSIAEIINVTMQVNVDFADVETVMKDSGVAIMGSATAEGENRAIRAAESAIDSPLLNDNHIEGARYILLNITSGAKEVTMDEVGEINDYIQEQAGQTADIIMGIGKDDTLGDKLSVTIIATGFKTSEQLVNKDRKPERIVHVLSNDKQSPVTSHPISVNDQKNEMGEMQVKNEDSEGIVLDPLEPVLIIKEEVKVEKEMIELKEEKKDDSKLNNGESFIIYNLEEEEPKIVELELPLDLDPPSSKSPLKMQEPIDMFDEPAAQLYSFELSENQSLPTAEDELFRRSRERIMRLKENSYKMNTPSGIAELENQPAYKRRNVVLNNVPPSSESNVSRFTLTTDETEKKTELRTNNPFLHDRVD